MRDKNGKLFRMLWRPVPIHERNMQRKKIWKSCLHWQPRLQCRGQKTQKKSLREWAVPVQLETEVSDTRMQALMLWGLFSQN